MALFSSASQGEGREVSYDNEREVCACDYNEPLTQQTSYKHYSKKVLRRLSVFSFLSQQLPIGFNQNIPIYFVCVCVTDLFTLACK